MCPRDVLEGPSDVTPGEPSAPTPPESRDHGPQPFAQLMEQHGLTPNALVEASKTLEESPEKIPSAAFVTHKMVSRGLKGRHLNPKVRMKLVAALNAASGGSYGPRDLFNYLVPRGD